ncbi:hypothetical protein PAENIP36_41840 [Paenibacillus sp. P36]
MPDFANSSISFICLVTDVVSDETGVTFTLPLGVDAGLEETAGVALGAVEGVDEGSTTGLGDELAIGSAALAAGFSFDVHAVNISILAINIG